MIKMSQANLIKEFGRHPQRKEYERRLSELKSVAKYGDYKVTERPINKVEKIILMFFYYIVPVLSIVGLVVFANGLFFLIAFISPVTAYITKELLNTKYSNQMREESKLEAKKEIENLNEKYAEEFGLIVPDDVAMFYDPTPLFTIPCGCFDEKGRFVCSFTGMPLESDKIKCFDSTEPYCIYSFGDCMTLWNCLFDLEDKTSDVWDVIYIYRKIKNIYGERAKKEYEKETRHKEGFEIQRPTWKGPMYIPMYKVKYSVDGIKKEDTYRIKDEERIKKGLIDDNPGCKIEIHSIDLVWELSNLLDNWVPEMSTSNYNMITDEQRSQLAEIDLD